MCDKGGECPLQDITFGWGGGHLALHRAQAPLRQAAGALAADRDRPRALHPLLPLRALLPGDLRGLPAGAARARRALLRLDLRRAPLRRAVQRQHRRAVPGRRAHLAPLPLPRAPVGHRGRGLGVHAVPGAVQRHAHRARRARAARARARATPRSTTAGCATRAASPTSRFHVDERITEPLVRDGGQLRPVSWERALEEAAAGLRARGRAHAARSPAAQSTNEEGLLLARLMREGLGSPHLDSRRAGALPLELHRALGDPRCRRSVSDLEFAHAVLVLDTEPVDDAPILDLRLRKGVRRHGLQARRRLPAAELARRQRRAVACATRRARARRSRRRSRAALRTAADVEQLARAGRRRARRRARAGSAAGRASCCAAPAASEDAAREVVVLWGERLTAGADGAPARRRCWRSPTRSAGRRRRRGPAGSAAAAATAAACARRACCPTPAPGCCARRRRPATRARRARDRRGPRRRRAQRAVPAALRPAARAARPRAVGARAGAARAP